MEYRPEIDGLRAVAVIPVILFHAGYQVFSGGFVGVDVFFVISGYLITTIILSEKERGTFSLVNFYERRIRRILPALFLVMFVTIPVAWLWLLPADMMAFSQSLIAVSTFSSNIFFWQTSGYWGEANELIPLLHTWSLAVEEQYYLIFPLFLMLVWRFHKRWILSTFVAIAAASLFLAQFGAHHYPTANFFLLITRGWELAIGASIAFFFVYRRPTVHRFRARRSVNEAFSIIGLLMIGFSVFAFDESVPFPSIYALVPTLGTGLIVLFAAPRTTVGRLLGMKLFVGIGLISYSAYLWHLPLFAFARYRSLTAPSTMLFAILAVLSVALAYLSWRFVERPFRKRGLLKRKAIFTFAAIGSSIFIAIGMAGHLNSGWPARIDGQLQALLDAAKLPGRGDELCLANEQRIDAAEGTCTLVRSDSTFAYLAGDSHGIAVANVMKKAFEQTDVGLIQATERGCPPVQNVFVYVSESDRLRCFEHNEGIYRQLEQSSDIEYVVLVARWALYISGERFDNGEGGVEREETLYFDATASEPWPQTTVEDAANDFGRAYRTSVEKLLHMQKKVILVYPIPEAGWNVPRFVRNYYRLDRDRAFSPYTGSTSYEVFKNRNRSAYQALDAISDHQNLFRVYPADAFCDNDVEQRCLVQRDDALLYADDDHLSDAGAMLVVKEVMSHLQ